MAILDNVSAETKSAAKIGFFAGITILVVVKLSKKFLHFSW
jgi:hypothetical protein